MVEKMLRENGLRASHSLTYSTILQAPSFIELYLMNNYMEFNNFQMSLMSTDQKETITNLNFQ